MTFLDAVAGDIRRRFSDRLHDLTIVLPNKRAALFLEQSLANNIDKPIWGPRYITVSELFQSMSSLHIGDELKLIADLFKSFCACTGREESLDEFFGWGQILLSDFDDIDKHLADAQQVFNNVRDLHELDSVDYLTSEQKESIVRFFHNFTPDHSSHLRDNFIHLWSQLLAVYQDFRSRLQQQRLAYQGQLYRDVVEQLDSGTPLDALISHPTPHYLFIGFNLLLPTERRLFVHIKRQSHALFYWDYDRYYLHGDHEAGRCIKENLVLFGNALDEEDDTIYGNFTKEKTIRVVNTSTETLMARYATQWLDDIPQEERTDLPPNTAVVLCNEQLLDTVIHSIPGNIDNVNITIGYPLSHTSVASLLQHLLNLFHHGLTDNGKRLRYKFLSPILQHPLIQQYAPQAATLVRELNADHQYYPLVEDLCVDATLQELFGTIPDTTTRHPSSTSHLSQWLIHIVDHLARHFASASPKRPNDQSPKRPTDPLTAEAIYRAYTLLNRLHTLIEAGDLTIDTNTYRQLVRQLISTTTIPFHGEPAIGLQVMGMLETRNLDFDNVLLLSVSEQFMPRINNETSFIPYSLRRAYGLTTNDLKTEVQSYHFYRLLQRARRITLAYCDTPSKTSTGEISRFILQLLTESPHHIQRITLNPHIGVKQFAPTPIQKTPQILTLLHQKQTYSPTAINHYLQCPIRFCYEHLGGLRNPDNINEDNIDQRAFGTLFHNVVQKLYQPFVNNGRPVTAKDIDYILHHPRLIESTIDTAYQELLTGDADGNAQSPKQLNDQSSKQRSNQSHRRLNINGTQLIISNVIKRYVHNLLLADRPLTPLYIIGLERKVSMPFTVSSDGRQYPIALEGTIDRLEAKPLEGGGWQVRVVDYKTGGRKSIIVSDVDEVFDHSKNGIQRGYYLQTLLYSAMVEHTILHGDGNKVSPLGGLRGANFTITPMLLYIRDYKPDNNDIAIKFGKEDIADMRPLTEDLKTNLQGMFQELFDPARSFQPAADKDRCKYCHCRQLCAARS